MKMRFPYIYQLISGFILVILTLMAITSFSFIRFGRTQVLNQVEEDFLEYAELIHEAEVNSDLEKLQVYKEILANMDVEYGIFDKKGVLEYPQNSHETQVNLNEEDLVSLKSDEKILLRIHENDLSGNKKDTAIVYVPIIDENNHYEGFIGVGRPVSQIETVMQGVKKNFFKAFLIATFTAIMVSILLSYFLVKRINRLSKASQRVATGDYNIYIDHSNRDEIDRLSADFNKMIKALKSWRQEVLHLEERRKTFMQDAIHEMRTPLTTINGLLEGLEYGIFDKEQEVRSIKIMKKETNRLIRLVNENLDYENIQSNRIVLQKHHFLLEEAMTEISEQLSTIAEDENNKIEIANSVRNISIYADFDRFKQILVNLLKNAMQFTDEGIIKVEAFENKRYTFVIVTDSGIGMTEEQLKSIWDRYYKSDPSRKNTKFGESGLGLPIVKKLMELHDGYIEVESELGKGSTFKLAFPKKLNKK